MAEEEYLPPHPSPRAMNGPMRFATGRGSFFQRSIRRWWRGLSGLTSRRSPVADQRSEEHTSELQSLMRISYAVFCLKKKNDKHNNTDLRSHKQPKNENQT